MNIMHTKNASLAPIAAAMACLLLPMAAHGQVYGTLLLDPNNYTPTVGSTVVAAVQYWGTPPLRLGAYDLTLTFDPALVEVTGVTFGTGLNLGNAADSEPLYSVTAGTLRVQEVSYASSLAGQTQGFGLFDIAFKTLAPGFNQVNFSHVDLSDQGGNPMPTPSTVFANSFTTVPEPEAFAAVMGLGLAGLALWRRGRASGS